MDDEAIVASFERIEEARGDISLTYFEFNTLAAVDIFMRENVDVMILEVGLGGRLDAVNVFDADCAVVVPASIWITQSFLGDTVEQVEVFLKKPACSAAASPLFAAKPAARIAAPRRRGIVAELLLAGRDFGFSRLEQQQWLFHFHPQAPDFSDGLKRNRNALPVPALRGAYQLGNAACALAVIECLNAELPIDIGAIKRGLLLVSNPRGFQVLPGRPLVILDVGHNPHAARALRQGLMALPFAEKRIAVFSMLADKDMDAVIEIVKDQFDEWYLAPLALPRGQSAQVQAQKLEAHGIGHVHCLENVAAAYHAALAGASENDNNHRFRIVSHRCRSDGSAAARLNQWQTHA